MSRRVEIKQWDRPSPPAPRVSISGVFDPAFVLQDPAEETQDHFYMSIMPHTGWSCTVGHVFINQERIEHVPDVWLMGYCWWWTVCSRCYSPVRKHWAGLFPQQQVQFLSTDKCTSVWWLIHTTGSVAAILKCKTRLYNVGSTWRE